LPLAIFIRLIRAVSIVISRDAKFMMTAAEFGYSKMQHRTWIEFKQAIKTVLMKRHCTDNGRKCIAKGFTGCKV